jgi:glucose/arabinose dehydrogenase
MKKTVITLSFLLCIAHSAISVSEEKASKPPPPTSVAINPITVKASEYIRHIKLPPGFVISIYAENVPGARSMTISPSGTVFVGTWIDSKRKNIGKVYAVVDKNNDFKADDVITIAENLNSPNGVAYRAGNLYVAEIHRIIRYDEIESTLNNPPKPIVINDTYPEDSHHGWKFIRFGPDGRLYVPVGAPCNICEPDAAHAVITSIKTDGSDKRTYARGIRNTVGFDWHPVTKELWFADNGRDVWGDNIPPEELNHAPTAGLHFGFPYRYGKALVDPEFKTELKESDFTPPALELPPHNAPLGMRFYTGGSFPDSYKNQIFIASHGSWNRNPPDGYRIFSVKLENNKAVSYEVFASGWLNEEHNFWGRPVDMVMMKDGSMLVSDDHAGVIYRIHYEK